jgi:hypothetical protein
METGVYMFSRSIRIDRYIPKKCLGVYPLLGSWNEFAGKLIEAPLDGYITRATYM